MTEHQKLATLLIRIVGAGLAGLMVLSFIVYGVEKLAGLPTRTTTAHLFAVDGWYLFIGIIMVVTSRRIGRLLGAGLD
ncbi:hypothetical protein JR064_19070 [Xanthomonas sp. CFBP 8703]|uniref:Uncharacterized protein n=1 Tax=Xanthomonas bonasiae TaxID=2810351 RepID=A0ABS3B6N0_9XANT|nr:hypothetical protein [Xanthomonas bonasiae]MBN6104269.1 hypothetical protein [Xanthomonas bonasiae]